MNFIFQCLRVRIYLFFPLFFYTILKYIKTFIVAKKRRQVCMERKSNCSIPIILLFMVTSPSYMKGYVEVSKALIEGAVHEEAEYARLNNIPFLNSSSKLGVVFLL